MSNDKEAKRLWEERYRISQEYLNSMPVNMDAWLSEYLNDEEKRRICRYQQALADKEGRTSIIYNHDGTIYQRLDPRMVVPSGKDDETDE